MEPNEKIQLDDITFDDVIAGDGVDTVAIDEIDKPVEEVKEEPTNELDDIEDTVEETEVEEKTEDVQNNEIDDDVEPSEEGSEDTIVSEVLSKLGYEVNQEYADTSEGLANMTKDIASQIADDRIDEVLEAFPLVKEHLQYVMNGGESQNFMQAYDPNLDYNRIELAEDDTRSQKAILSDYFTTKGHDKEFIEEILEDYEDSGKLHNKAEAARQALGKVQSQHKSQMVEKQKQVLQEQYQEQMEDPVLQMQKQELEIKQQSAESKASIDEAKIAADMQKATMKDELERIKIDAENEREGARIGAEIAKVSAQERTKAAELGRKIADKLLDQD